jgi:hypothetical protein
MIENKIPYRIVPKLTDLTIKWSQKAGKSENLKKSKGVHSSIFSKKPITIKTRKKMSGLSLKYFFRNQRKFLI